MTETEHVVNGIRIELRANGSNQLPALLADLAEDSGDAHNTTAARWGAVAAENSRMTLRRVVWLPAVPRPGEVIYVDPYTEELQVQSVTWRVDPDGDEPMVSIQLSDIDFDVIGNDDDALDAFLTSGWTAED